MDILISSFAVLRTSKEAFPQDSKSLILLPFCKTLVCARESEVEQLIFTWFHL